MLGFNGNSVGWALPTFSNTVGKAHPTKTFLLGALLLSGCVPSMALQARTLNAIAVSDRGDVAWVLRGDAFVAQAGAYQLTPISTPALVSSVTWRDSSPWFALPAAGLVVKGTGTPESVSFTGRPAVLTSNHVFSLEGGVFTFDGASVGRMPSGPVSVLETKGRTFAISGKVIFEVSKTRVSGLERVPEDVDRPVLVEGVPVYQVVEGPSVSAGGFRFRIVGNTLENISTNASINLEGEALALAGSGDFLAVLSSTNVIVVNARTFGKLADIRVPRTNP